MKLMKHAAGGYCRNQKLSARQAPNVGKYLTDVKHGETRWVLDHRHPSIPTLH